MTAMVITAALARGRVVAMVTGVARPTRARRGAAVATVRCEVCRGG
jgi:hypothetical protein